METLLGRQLPEPRALTRSFSWLTLMLICQLELTWLHQAKPFSSSILRNLIKPLRTELRKTATQIWLKFAKG